VKGLSSQGESEGARERKERGEGGRDGRSKRLRVMATKRRWDEWGSIALIGYPPVSSMAEARQEG